jgi:hypothetical protein
VSETRRFEGDQTWLTLRDWIKGQKASERLAGVILKSEGYLEVDPSHPLGGKDGGKDILCRKDCLTFVGAVYFPRGQQYFPDIKKKFALDLRGVEKNQADGLVFVTNQELKLGERKELENVNPSVTVELYHLERLTLLLNVPKHYGIRLEYLDIDITKEEYLAFIAYRDEEHYHRLQQMTMRLDGVLDRIEKQTNDLIGYTSGGTSIVFLTPSVFAQRRVDFYLHNTGDYPVFDIQVYYCDDDEPVDFEQGECRRFTEVPLGPIRTIYPKMTPPFPTLTFEMDKRDRLAVTVFIQTRTIRIVQLIRCFKIESEIIAAYKVEVGDKVMLHVVPATVPGYNPDDPEAVFK